MTEADRIEREIDEYRRMRKREYRREYWQRPEVKARNRERQRMRYQKIKADPELYAVYLERQKKYYQEHRREYHRSYYAAYNAKKREERNHE